jgi:hypothetical protein
MFSLRAASGLVVLSAVCFLVGAGEPLQKDQDPKKQDKDPQSTVEPRSNPGSGQKFLEKFVGDWEVAKAFYPRSGGEPARAKGECRQTMIQEGRFLQSDFVFQQPDGKKSTGLGIIGFDTDTGRFTSFWVDSRSTRTSIRQSEGKFNGEEIVLFSKSLDPDAKDARRSRTVTRLEENGSKLVHRQYSIGADGKDRLMMELLMTRKAATAVPQSK